MKLLQKQASMKYQVLAKAKRAMVKSTMIMECLHKQKEKNGMFLTYLLSLKLAIAQEFRTEMQHFLHHLYYRMPALSQKKTQHQLLIRTKFKEQERRLERTICLQAIPLFIQRVCILTEEETKPLAKEKLMEDCTNVQSWKST